MEGSRRASRDQEGTRPLNLVMIPCILGNYAAACPSNIWARMNNGKRAIQKGSLLTPHQ